MPEITPPADGTQGDGEGSPTPATTPQQTPAPKSFSQDEVNRMIAERLARAKPDDYDEAKAALERERTRKEEEKTELQKLADAKTAAEAERDEARTEAAKIKRDAAIQLEAYSQGADAEMVVLALANDSTIKVAKDGSVEGAKEAVEKLLERKPNLKLGTGTRSGGEFGGKDSTTVAEEIAALEREGTPASIAKARELKIAQHFQSS